MTRQMNDFSKRMQSASGRRQVMSGMPYLAAILVAGSILAGCDDFSRFKQERYECNQNRHGLVEMDFRSTKIGDEVATIFTSGTVMATIAESTDTTFTLIKDKIIIRIDRESGAVRMTKGTRYSSITCEKTIFKM